VTRRLLTVLLLAIVALCAAAPAAALAQDNSATAVNTRDDSSVLDLAFSVKKVSGEVVDQTNSAVAYSSCERCQTVAIAIQVLIVMTDSPDVVTPQNIAIAINEECSSCTTMALAYQLVVGTGGPVELTPRGRREIARIRHDLKRLEHSGLSPAEIRDRTAELVDQLRDVLARELVPVRREDGDNGRRSHDETTGRQGDEDQGVEPGEPPADQTTPTDTTPAETTPTTTTPPSTDTTPEQQPTTPTTTTPEQPAPDDGQTQTTP
jgi:putative peptide zinc metalloprotease protein